MSPDRCQLTRRTVLGIAGASIAAVAGCVGGDDTSDSTGSEETPSPTDESAALDEPTAFPADEECAVCGMMVAEHHDWNAQLAHEDGTRTYFCSSGCLSAYYVDPQRFDGPQSEVTHAWVTDYATGDLVEAADAHFVQVSDPDHVDDIMKMNPAPYADRADAEAFVDNFEAYDSDDIISLAEFDMELALQYRRPFFEEDKSGDDAN